MCVIVEETIIFIWMFHLIIEKDVQIFYEERSISLSTVFID